MMGGMDPRTGEIVEMSAKQAKKLGYIQLTPEESAALKQMSKEERIAWAQMKRQGKVPPLANTGPNRRERRAQEAKLRAERTKARLRARSKKHG